MLLKEQSAMCLALPALFVFVPSVKKIPRLSTILTVKKGCLVVCKTLFSVNV